MKTKLYLLVAIIALLLLFCTSAHAEGTWLYYSGEEIKGTVVDADTKEPIEGAIVIAQWQLTEVPGGGFGGFAHIGDTVSGKDGSFTIPSWWSFRPWKLISVIHRNAPRIFIYKPGYGLYWSHKLARAGYPERMDLTKEEKAKSKEANSLTPAKLKRIYTDESVWETYKEFRSQAHFPEDYYSARQIKGIYTEIEKYVAAVQPLNNLEREKIIKNIRESIEYWYGGKR